MPRPDRRRSLLLDVFDRSFRGPAWHGTPLWGALRGVRVAEALWRPGRGRHCIWELVLHAAYWKCVVRRRLLRNAAVTFPRAGNDWPRLPGRTDAAAGPGFVLRRILQIGHEAINPLVRLLPGHGDHLAGVI